MGNSYTVPEKESVVYPAFEAEAPSLKGKTIAITGTTSGTGLVAAKFFAQKGADKLFCLNRPSARAEAALEQITAVAAEGTKVVHVDCDLMDFASVRAAAAKVLEADTLDVLCHNAGVMALRDQATTDGYDVQMQTNHLSSFLLTKELYPALQRAPEARIVLMSSGGRKFASGGFTKDVAEEYLGQNGGKLGGDGASMLFNGARWVRYNTSKLANAVFCLALKDRLPANVKSFCATPGLAATNLQATTNSPAAARISAETRRPRRASDSRNEVPSTRVEVYSPLRSGAFGFMNSWIMRWAQSGEDGTVPLLTCCVSPGLESGSLVEPSGGLRGPAAVKEWDAKSLEGDRDALWAASEAAVGRWNPVWSYCVTRSFK